MRHATRTLPATLILLLLVAPGWTATAGTRATLAEMDDELAALLRGAEDASSLVPVVILYHDAPGRDDAQALLARGFVPPFVRYDIVPAVAAVGPASAIAETLRDPGVAYVRLDAAMPYHTDRAKIVGRAIDAWTASWKDALGEVHAGGIIGRGIRVAVVDSGVDATHPDLLWAPLATPAGLQPTTAFNFKVLGRDSVGAMNLPNSATDGFVEASALGVDMADTDTTGGHGTHVAGTVAGNGFASDGKYRGSAPGAQLVGYGAGETLLVSVGLAAFDHIHKHHEALGIRVVTNSWGGPGDWKPNDPVTIAVRRLVNEDGLVLLFSAGNDGGDGNEILTSVWANIPEVISVANYYDQVGWLEPSSSRGLASLERTWPDLAAPGTQIISTAASGKPVTFVCTGQDAAIDELDEGPEPTVVPVPTPLTTEQDVDGERVIVGPYASCTGTSMATPFVAGVVALILEANPALDPFTVRDILRGTANMPRGRTYAEDGFAVGRGIVDAVEAVAVALRMRDGASLDEALRTAYVDLSGETALLNFEESAHLDLATDAPAPAGTLRVSGTFVPGPRTDNEVPLQPGAGVVTPVDAILSVYQPTLGGANPCAGYGGCAVGGVTVDLGSRNMVSLREDVVLTQDTQVRHLVYRDDELYAAPQTTFSFDSVGEGRADALWTPPENEMGSYVFAAEILVGDAWEEYGREPLLYVPSSGVPPLPGPPTAASVVLSEGFENGAPGWTTRQDSVLGPAQLTAWSFIREGEGITWAGAHSGRTYAYVGVEPTAQTASLLYTDLADASLVSPAIDLAGAERAELRFWRAGGSEVDVDLLQVLVETEGALVELDSVSRDVLNEASVYEEVVLPLDAFVGGIVRVHFRFTSDAASASPNFPGWSIDDVKVLVVTDVEPFVDAILTASAVHGIDALETTIAYGASSNVPIVSYTLDLGDGSAPLVAPASGMVARTYAPGTYVVTLAILGVGAADVATLVLDVAPSGVVQVRIAGRAWTDAGVVPPGAGAPTPFEATLDLAGLSGAQLVEARLYDADGALTVASQVVEVG